MLALPAAPALILPARLSAFRPTSRASRTHNKRSLVHKYKLTNAHSLCWIYMIFQCFVLIQQLTRRSSVTPPAEQLRQLLLSPAGRVHTRHTAEQTPAARLGSSPGNMDANTPRCVCVGAPGAAHTASPPGQKEAGLSVKRRRAGSTNKRLSGTVHDVRARTASRHVQTAGKS